MYPDTANQTQEWSQDLGRGVKEFGEWSYPLGSGGKALIWGLDIKSPEVGDLQIILQRCTLDESKKQHSVNLALQMTVLYTGVHPNHKICHWYKLPNKPFYKAQQLSQPKSHTAPAACRDQASAIYTGMSPNCFHDSAAKRSLSDHRNVHRRNIQAATSCGQDWLCQMLPTASNNSYISRHK